jgi:hypothetical protein
MDVLASAVDRVNVLPYPKTVYDKGWIYGVWYCGTSWQKANYYGQFPATFVKRVTTMFPPKDFRFLHLCCGRAFIDYATNVDIHKLPEVDVQWDVEDPLPFHRNSFDVVLIDPPYSEQDADRYKVKRLIRPKKVLENCRNVLTDGGWVLWLDEKYPSYRRKEWKICGLIGIVTGFERRVRVLSMFRKHPIPTDQVELSV